VKKFCYTSCNKSFSQVTPQVTTIKSVRFEETSVMSL
jgi:hypothetical protein